MKNYYYLSLSVLLAMFSACTETPTEPEPNVTNVTVINDVSDSLSIAQQLASLNEAGAFYNVNMKILDGASPIVGAEVKLTSSAGGEIIETISTSDVNGNVVFDGVTVGGNIIEISSEGYYSALGLIDFKFEKGYNYEIIDDVVAPITKNESAIIPLYAAENSALTAQISGKVIIETDLTNDNPEVVANQLIKADFSGNIAQVSEGINFQAYSLNVEGGLGEAITDNEGVYQLVIPTGNNGINVGIIIPEFQLKQKIAFVDSNTQEATLDSLFTTFSANVTASEIPEISGIKAIIPEPEPEGRGIQINNKRRAGRPLFGNSGYTNYNIETTDQLRSAYSLEYLFNGGAGYQSKPSVLITDETGTGAIAQAIMGYAIKNIVVDSLGQFNPNTSIRYEVNVYYDNNSSYPYNQTIYSGRITSNDSGQITQNAIDEEFQEAFITSNWFGDNYNNLYNQPTMDSIVFEFQGYFYGVKLAEVSVEYDAKILELRIINEGDNYINPSITFEGGNPTTAASFEISNFQTPWTFEFDNSANETPYVSIPKIDIEFFNGFNYTIGNNLSNENGGYTNTTDAIISQNGEITFRDATIHKTTKYSIEEPTFYITEPTHEKPQINFTVSNSKLYYYSSSLGYYYQNGKGYKEKFNIQVLPQFTEIPGEGAEVTIIGGSQKGDEYRWYSDLIIQNRGSGYLDNVNQTTVRSFNMSNTTNQIFLKAGERKLLDIDYGTGYRPQN